MAEFEVREALESDIRQLYVLCRKMWIESPEYRDREFAALKVVANLERYITSSSRCAFVATSGGYVIGYMLGYTYDPEMTDELAAADRVLYVEKPYRSGKIGLELLQRYLGWAKEQGATAIYFGTTSGLTPEAAAKLMRHANLEVVGQIARLR